MNKSASLLDRSYLSVRRGVAGLCLVLSFVASPVLGVTPAVPALASPVTTLAGQSATQLADGRWLLAGGRGTAGALDELVIRTNALSENLPVHLIHARSGHTATVLPGGQVWVFGGVGADGKLVLESELVDPVEGAVMPLATTGLTARTEHTATVLTSGDVLLAGGRGGSGAPLATADRWNPRSGAGQAVTATLEVARYAHTAALLASGEGLLSGGLAQTGQPVTRAELYDPRTARFEGGITVIDPRVQASQLEAVQTAVVMESQPSHNAVDVPLDSIIGIRFNHPVPIERLTASVITMVGPNGAVAASVSGAEHGMLAFVVPAQELRPATTYTVFVTGLTDADGNTVPRTSVRFTTHRIVTPDQVAQQPVAPVVSLKITPKVQARLPTRPTSDAGTKPQPLKVTTTPPVPPQTVVDEVEDWIPTKANLGGRWRVLGLPQDPATPAHDTVVEPLQAPAGTTAVSGRVVRVNGLPLSGVVVKQGKHSTLTDATGSFLLTGLTAGRQSLQVDGTGVLRDGRHYPQHFIAVNVVADRTTTLPSLVYLSRVDPATEVAISSPAAHEIVLTHPAMPGLEVHVPKGAVIRDQTGKVVTKLSLTPIPMDRAPYPSPVPFSTYFTLQPGGAYVDGDPSQALKVIYPNNEGLPAGHRVDFWNYDVATGWRLYGHGQVSADAKTITPDSSVTFRQVMTFGLAVSDGGGAPPATGPAPGSNCTAADPVDCPTGLFLKPGVDLVVNDVIPISASRLYRSNDNQTHAFGTGTNLSYGVWLYTPSTTLQQEIDLIQADGSRIPFIQVTGSNPIVWKHTSTPTKFYGATLVVNENLLQWQMTLLDGSVMRFSGNQAVQPLTQLIDRHGNSVQVSYAAPDAIDPAVLPMITQVTSPTGRYIRFFYDSLQRVNQAVDDAGRSVSYGYDTLNHLTSVTDANGYTERYGYDPVSNNMNLVTDRRGNAATQNQYDANGRVSQQTLADGAIWKFSYALNPNGTVAQTTVTDPRNYVRQITMSATGYPAVVIHALGQPEQQTTTILRDSASRPWSVTDTLGRTTLYGYNTSGDLTSVTALAGTANQIGYAFTYDPIYHQLTSVQDPLGHTTLVQRDGAGNAVAISDPLGHTTNVHYNSLGLPTSVTDALSHTIGIAYAGADLASITDALGRKSVITTDSLGRVLTSADPLGNTTQFNRDAMDRVQTVIDALGQTTTLGYDPNGNLSTVKDPRNVIQTYTYDSRNRRHTYLDPAGKTETDNYDGLSNLTSVVDRKSQTTSISYDGINRPTLITFQDASTITITWDGGNRATKYVDSLNGTISRTYDGLDRLTQEVTSQGTVNYTFDNASRRATMTVVGQTQVVYTFDNANRLTAITQGSNAVGIAYDAANRVSTVTWPNGVVGTYTLDNANQLTALSFAKGATVIGTLGYGYDLGGRRTSLSGTLAAFVPPMVAPSITYDGTNRLTSRLGQALTYDANGNLTGLGSMSYTWNARNQLVSTSAGTSIFAYDALGRRTSATVGGAATSYEYDGLNPVMMGGNFMLAGLGLDENYAQVASGSATSILPDGLGSTLALSNASATTTATYAYSPYGDTTKTGTDSTQLDYTGRENDGATGLYYYRARYYSPQLGRFVSEDPAGMLGGLNRYAYVGGSPVALKDSLGLWALGDPIDSGVANAVTGFGDGVYHMVTLGIGDLNVVRGFAGICGGIDQGAGAYNGGKYAGWAFGAGLFWSAGLNGGANSVFWSAANAGRAQNYGVTMAMTPIGNALDLVAPIVPSWLIKAASGTFALNAEGIALKVGTEAGAIWSSIEAPILAARGVPVVTVL